MSGKEASEVDTWILIAAAVGSSEIADTEAEAGSPSLATTTTTISPPTPETVSVPDVTGNSVVDATSELEAAGFGVFVETKLTNSDPKDTVLSQSEPAGSLLELGGTITLTVAEPLPKIPNVVGKTLANAKRALTNVGFEVGKVTQQTSSKSKGTVISQSPDAGTSVRPGRTVSLVTQSLRRAVEQLHAGLLALPATGIGLRLLGGTGDGPESTGFVRVTGSDPYGLDADSDGTGCE